MELTDSFKQVFKKNPHYIFSAPGRSEIGGNHTDHQHGKVLAAAISLDCRAAVCENDSNMIRLFSDGYGLSEISFENDGLSVNPAEYSSTGALIRGVAAAFSGKMEGIDFSGGELRGFDAYVHSDVLVGSGLSSSAAFEVLLAAIINHIGGYGLSQPEIARIAQFAENKYFGKPCGLMDQMACANGNLIGIDFNDPSKPVITPLDFDFSKSGYGLCIIDSGADHAGLTDEYAAIPIELRSICDFFGKDFLRDVSEEEFYESAAALRLKCGDRAFLRAIHVFEDNKRVEKQIKALEENDFDSFLSLVKASGSSSWQLLQNVTVSGATAHQELACALALAEHYLYGKGAFRVQGGGFAGTIEAFVPIDMIDRFKDDMETALGEGSCHVLSIRKEGAVLEQIIGNAE